MKTRGADRRRREKAWAIEAGRRAVRGQPTVMGVFEHRGETVAFLTVEPDQSWPEVVHEAWIDRGRAAVTGRCPRCGVPPNGGPLPKSGVVNVTMHHEPDCLLRDDVLFTIIGRHVLGGRS